MRESPGYQSLSNNIDKPEVQVLTKLGYFRIPLDPETLISSVDAAGVSTNRPLIDLAHQYGFYTAPFHKDDQRTLLYWPEVAGNYANVTNFCDHLVKPRPDSDPRELGVWFESQMVHVMRNRLDVSRHVPAGLTLADSLPFLPKALAPLNLQHICDKRLNTGVHYKRYLQKDAGKVCMCVGVC